MGVAKRGAHHLSIEVPYPFAEGTSQKVTVNMRDGSGQRPLLATQTVDQVINWPNPMIWQLNQQTAKNTPEQNLQRAVVMIDSGGEQQLGESRFILERLIDQNKQFEPAYIELARIAMKSNWSPEGLHQAETLLDTAMNIRPDSVNAKILLGYVYAHQQHFDRARNYLVRQRSQTHRIPGCGPIGARCLSCSTKRTKRLANIARSSRVP